MLNTQKLPSCNKDAVLAAITRWYLNEYGNVEERKVQVWVWVTTLGLYIYIMRWVGDSVSGLLAPDRPRIHSLHSCHILYVCRLTNDRQSIIDCERSCRAAAVLTSLQWWPWPYLVIWSWSSTSSSTTTKYNQYIKSIKAHKKSINSSIFHRSFHWGIKNVETPKTKQMDFKRSKETEFNWQWRGPKLIIWESH